jgi:hypothetical protein
MLEGLLPGTWEIECEMARTGDSAEKQTVEVIAGQTVAIEFGKS